MQYHICFYSVVPVCVRLSDVCVPVRFQGNVELPVGLGDSERLQAARRRAELQDGERYREMVLYLEPEHRQQNE